MSDLFNDLKIRNCSSNSNNKKLNIDIQSKTECIGEFEHDKCTIRIHYHSSLVSYQHFSRIKFLYTRHKHTLSFETNCDMYCFRMSIQEERCYLFYNVLIAYDWISKYAVNLSYGDRIELTQLVFHKVMRYVQLLEQCDKNINEQITSLHMQIFQERMPTLPHIYSMRTADIRKGRRGKVRFKDSNYDFKRCAELLNSK